MKRVAIVGGGIAGLATAYYMEQCGQGKAEYTLIESAPRLGGKIVSARDKGFVIEGGPDSFLTTKPAAVDLCRELGLGSELIGTNDAGRKVYVWSRGKLRAMPDGVMLIIPTRIMPFLKSPLLSWPGKVRMGMDILIPPRRDDGDESLAHFVRRRLGNEALDRIAEPMIAGIYVADAEYLSLKSTFPRFLDMENKYGGLLKGVLAQKRASKGKPPNPSSGSMFMTLRGGLQDMVDAMQTRLNRTSILLNRSAIAIAPNSSRYDVTLSDGSCLSADHVVLASPAFATADMLERVDGGLADSLRTIRYVSTATVSFGFKRSELGHPLNGFGFVVPRSERRQLLACTWSSTKFNNRAQDGYVLVRAFIGGAHAEQLAEKENVELEDIALSELRAMMGIAAEPVIARVYRWHKANPQYAVGHAERVKEIEERLARHSGLHLAGGAYHGVGIPDCIEDGKRVVDKILDAA